MKFRALATVCVILGCFFGQLGIALPHAQADTHPTHHCKHSDTSENTATQNQCALHAPATFSLTSFDSEHNHHTQAQQALTSDLFHTNDIGMTSLAFVPHLRDNSYYQQTFFTKRRRE